MRVAFIAEHYPPTEGGVATSAQRVARGLVRMGVNVQVFCFDNSQPITAGDYLLKEVDEGVSVARVGPFFLKHPDLNLNLLSEKVKAALRRRAFSQILRLAQPTKVEAVMSFYLLQAGYLAQFLARELGIPYIAGVRGNDIGLNIFHVERFGVTQWVVSGADRIVCVNEHLRRRLLLAFPEVKDKTCVIPNGIAIPEEQAPDQSARRDLLAASNWDDNDFIITFIGTLREKKGIVPLLKAVEQARHLPLRLLVIGPEIRSADAALCDDLLTKLKEDNRLFITGKLDRAEVKQWAAGADAVVMPSLDDGLANGLLEGMAIGLCPITSEVFSDVVNDKENGLIVPCNDHIRLADTFSRLARDRPLARVLGKNARRHVAGVHQPHKEASAYMNLLQSTVLHR
jgi:glycosyltransferase involved in cell wall biosynthesis